MTPGLNINMSDISDFNLSFLVDVGSTRWFQGEEKKEEDFLNVNLKSQITKNKIFEINSLIFKILTQDLNFADFTKEIMINLLEMAQKLGIETIYFLVAKKNPQYIKFVQDLMIIGFEVDTNTKTVNIEGNTYKVLKLQVKDQDEEIEEVF